MVRWCGPGFWYAIAFIVLSVLVVQCAQKSGRFANYPVAKSISPFASSAAADDSNAQLGAGCPQNSGQWISSSLLPLKQQADREYAALAPKDNDLTGKNFLTPRESFGVDTVGSSLRNANKQLRSEPPNPRVIIPFNNSTIAYDYGHADFEINACN